MEKMIIHPNTTGVFLDWIDCTSSRPIPGQAKTVSQITAPARSPPMRSPITVTVGIIALGTACCRITFRLETPLALAVRI